MNNILLVGRLTKDPEMKATERNNNVLNITIAVKRDFPNASGHFEADFIKCTLWNKLAISTSKFCKKGSLVVVKGRLQIRRYEKDGVTHFASEVVVERITFLSNPSKKVTEIENEEEKNIEAVLGF